MLTKEEKYKNKGDLRSTLLSLSQLQQLIFWQLFNARLWTFCICHDDEICVEKTKHIKSVDTRGNDGPTRLLKF